MKALLCKVHGPPEQLTLDEVAPPECGPKDVRIAVRAAGINFPDTLIIAGKYQFQPPLPFSPGGEVAGVILEVGAEVRGLAIGDRVMAVPGWGGLAEQVVVSAAKCFALPDAMDFTTAAVFGMTYGTCYHALVQRGHLHRGETLLVLGATGGIGTAAIEVGKCLGANVIAVSGSADKLARLQQAYGLEHVIHCADPSTLKDSLAKLTGGKGVDVVIDPVGGELFEPALRSLAWEGRLLIVGFASGVIPQAKANLLLLKGAAAVGVFWGAFATRDPAGNRANFEQLFKWYEAGQLRPLISLKVGLGQAAQAIAGLRDRTVVGKAVVEFG